MGLLNREQIFERLAKEEIFVKETWAESHLRPAGYDLRIAPGIRALNQEVYEDGKDLGEYLELEPGDAAYVLSVEKFCMPWDLAANLGLRFRYARQGLSVLTGLLVDPGFGLTQEDTKWKSTGAALHFFVTNIGSRTIRIALGKSGDGVLSLQFLETNKLDEKTETAPPGNVKPSTALWSFHSAQLLEQKFDSEQTKTTERFRELTTRVEELSKQVETTESATHNIVVFGVFLLAATLIGVTLAILLQALSDEKFGDLIANFNHLHSATAAIMTVVGMLLLVVLVIAASLGVTALVRQAMARR